MKLARWLIVVVVVLYAAWIAFPVVKAFVLPAEQGPNVPMMAQDDNDYRGGTMRPMDGDAGPTMDSIQGDTAVEAIETHNTPVVTLFSAVLILYGLAAWLHASGKGGATLTYVTGFIADLALTYLTNGNKGDGLYDKVLNILSGWDPRYVLTLVAMVLGFLIYVSRYRARKKVSGDTAEA